MGKLIAFEFMTVDGYMAGKLGHEMDWVKDGFNDEMEQDLFDQYDSLRAFVMGRTTFESLAGYWPTDASKDELLRDYMNTMEKLVCSTASTIAEWNNSRLLEPDAATELKSLKETSEKDLMIIGSSVVVQSLARQKLIDEFRFFLFPVVLGAG